MTKVRSEITSAVHSLPWLIARDEGYFAEEDLDAVPGRRPCNGETTSSSDPI